VETAFGSVAADKATAMAKNFGLEAVGSQVSDIAKNFIGDYLHTF
jgi:hypothetical protein